MAAVRRVLAIAIWFFCINVGALPDTTVEYKICNGHQISPFTAYSRNMYTVIDDLAENTAENAYNYYSQSSEGGQTCYGHAACAGHLTSFDCRLCLVNAGQDLVDDCPQNTGAQEQLKDCRMRYETYQFQEP